MANAKFIVGDVFDVLATLPSGSVDLVLTSPPFLALRSYLPSDHADKAREIGTEATPGAFIDTLLDLTEQCRRVLAPHGSIAVELGDTYAGSGGAGGDYAQGGLRDGQQKFRQVRQRQAWRMNDDGTPKHTDRTGEPKNVAHTTPLNGGDGWPLDKSLCLIPELYRISLVYGFNPLTGRTTERWRGRNVVRWHRPNPPVGALGDKFRPSTSDMVIACMDRRRYFDLDAVRSPLAESTAERAEGARRVGGKSKESPTGSHGRDFDECRSNPAGAPPLDTWVIPTEPYKGRHYATWPSALLTRLILAMCPQRVCRTCGKPSERIVSIDHKPNRSTNGPQSTERKHLDGGSAGYEVRADRVAETVGWTDCGHDDWRPGVVLDPFAGSGTTLAVATGHGRDAIGIDIDERNAELAFERVGWMLNVEYRRAEVGA